MSLSMRARNAVIPVHYAVIALLVSAAGVLAAVFRSVWVSVAAYCAVLILGCVFIYLQRRAAFLASMGARSRKVQRMPRIERAAVISVVVACFLNGLVIAFHLSMIGG